eukprot:gi/632972930/ref/XP_007902900.1/ PREDICTED: tyrosine-protein phosphatase non-receptor type substrate 1-like [Callorhinchus milii]
MQKKVVIRSFKLNRAVCLFSNDIRHIILEIYAFALSHHKCSQSCAQLVQGESVQMITMMASEVIPYLSLIGIIATVPPTPLKIFPRDSERDSKSLILVCETAEFYPGDVTLTWNKDGNEVKTEIDFTEEKNSKGLYKASSSMEDTQPVQSGAVYICLATHVSLRIPVVAVYTVGKSKGSGSQCLHKLIGGCAGGGLAFLLLLIIIGKLCQFNKRKGSHRNQNRLDHCEKQTKHGEENEPVTYVTLNLASSKKTPRPERQEERTVFAQMLQGAENESVTYAKMDLNRCKKTPRAKKQDEGDVYAQVKQRAAANNLTCRGFHVQIKLGAKEWDMIRRRYYEDGA